MAIIVNDEKKFEKDIEGTLSDLFCNFVDETYKNYKLFTKTLNKTIEKYKNSTNKKDRKEIFDEVETLFIDNKIKLENIVKEIWYVFPLGLPNNEQNENEQVKKLRKTLKLYHSKLKTLEKKITIVDANIMQKVEEEKTERERIEQENRRRKNRSSSDESDDENGATYSSGGETYSAVGLATIINNF